MRQTLQRRVEFNNITIELHNFNGSFIITLMVTSKYDHVIYTSVMNHEYDWTRLYNFANELGNVISKLQCEKVNAIIDLINEVNHVRNYN